MSRSGYTDEGDASALNMWRGAVASAINGARGQAMLRELAVALDAMPVKALVADSLVDEVGSFCTLGALGHARGIDMSLVNPEDYYGVARTFGVAPAMAREIVFMNDEGSYYEESDEQRWVRMRAWAADNIKGESMSADLIKRLRDALVLAEKSLTYASWDNGVALRAMIAEADAHLSSVGQSREAWIAKTEQLIDELRNLYDQWHETAWQDKVSHLITQRKNELTAHLRAVPDTPPQQASAQPKEPTK